MTRLGHTLSILIGASLGIACTGGIDDPTNIPPPGSTTGGDGNTFDHDNNAISIWALVDRLDKEGPLSFTSHMASCSKLHNATLANVLTAVGIDLTNTTPLSAGQLYRDGLNALGGPNYANRLRENIGVTTSGTSKMFDIVAAGADEIIAKVPTLARCTVAGVPAQLFNGDQCVASGLTCLLGVPAQPAHIEVCNLSISRASDQATGKRLAVAALMAAAYTCE